MYADGRGTQKDLEKARTFHAQGCDGGNMVGCVKWGLMLERGQGGEKDAARAQSLYARACNGGNRMACDLKR